MARDFNSQSAFESSQNNPRKVHNGSLKLHSQSQRKTVLKFPRMNEDDRHSPSHDVRTLNKLCEGDTGKVGSVMVFFV